MKVINILMLLLSLISFSWSQDKIVGFISDGGKEPTASQIRVLTHVCIAFLEPEGQMGDVRFTMSNERLSKIVDYSKLYGVKVLISFGGGGGATFTPNLLEVKENRERFISNLIQFVEDHKLDGIDCDIEPDYTSTGATAKETDSLKYINNISVRNNFNILLKEIRDSLTNRFNIEKKILTATVGDFNSIYYSTSEYMEDNVFWPNGLWEDADFINLMSYGVGKGGTGHGGYATVFGPEGSVQHWLSNGMPKEKMVYGVPFYGGANWIEAVKYSEIIKKVPNIDTTRDTITFNFGNGKKLYDFNSICTLRKKIEEGKRQNLAGVMFWDLNSDLPLEHPLSLLRVIATPSSSPIHHTQSFDTIYTQASFTKEIILTNHFSADQGDIIFSVENSPNRHNYQIINNILKITGDDIEDIGMTKVTIRATSTLNHLDIIEKSFYIIVNNRSVIIKDPTKNSSNWVLSQRWQLNSFNTKFKLPKDNNQLHTLTTTGDTVIHFIGTTLDTSAWNSITLSNNHSGLFNLELNPIIIEYKSDVANPAITMNVNFCDNTNTMHVYNLKMKNTEWQHDTIKINNLKPGWGQSNSFNYGNIKSVSIEIGSVNNESVYNFSLKRMEPIASTANLTMKPPSDRTFNVYKLKQNMLIFNSNLKMASNVSILSLRGQKIWQANIEAGKRVIYFNRPNLSRGVYIICIKNKESVNYYKHAI